MSHVVFHHWLKHFAYTKKKKCSFCKKEKCSPKYTLYDNKKQSQNWLGKQLRLLAVCFYALMGEKCSSSSTCLCPTLSVNTGEKSTVHLTWWQTQKWLDSVHSFTTHPNFPSLFFYKNISPYKRQLGIYFFFFFCNCHTTFDLKYICIDKPTVYKQILFSNHSMSEEAVRVLSAGTTQTFSSSFLRNIFFLGRTQARKRWIPSQT